ncbi:molecular chaperone HtpG [Taurinivorans muris]|uniref:Chaperone protein HtpG n=1 Tax=Taurinivorans muris TaxID=2787751 RepID=A0ABY5Y040_9BACT|nr:molecular chaperone HtpG [Desulfovibrionaceae bacterium LT0009]
MSSTYKFKAETHKVLNILTHSLYTNREIFLRELLSNASDALDKLRFKQNKGESILAPELPLEIKISTDKESNILTVQDTGIGMTKQEMQDNLGIIAKSGSEKFLKDIGDTSCDSGKQKIDPYAEEEIVEKQEGAGADASQIIGRFGIGFYSVFMVADKVEVYSVPAIESVKEESEAKAHVWTSHGSDTFTITPLEEVAGLVRGTMIKIYLKDDAKEFIEEYRLENIIRRHSNFLPFSILLNDKVINTISALWREPKFNIKKEQYDEFYKFLTYDTENPFDVIHLSVDAPVQFNALLFIPEKSEDYFLEQKDQWGLDLYVRRVLIEKNRQELLPNYFAFVKGVVDTEDLPLNISRETLQENIVLKKISQTIVRQLMSHFEKMAAQDKEKYNTFWNKHGKYFKFAFNDFVYRDRVAKLMRFVSSGSEELLSLEEYVSRMKAGQKDIWYVSASSKEAAKLNPHMERFTRKGLEVLYLLEPVEEIALESLQKFNEYTFKNIETADARALDDFADVEKAESDLPKLSDLEKTEFEQMLERMKEVLGDKVKDVKSTDRLSGSPACMASQDGVSSTMEKLMRSFQKDDSIPQKVLEVNPDHALIRSLLTIYKDDSRSGLFEEMVWGIFDNTVLLDGYMNDPFLMAQRSLKLMEKAGQWYADLRNK